MPPGATESVSATVGAERIEIRSAQLAGENKALFKTLPPFDTNRGSKHSREDGSKGLAARNLE